MICKMAFLSLSLVASTMTIGAGVDFVAGRPVWPKGCEKERNLTVGFKMTFAGSSARGGMLRYTGSSIVRVWLNGEVFAYGPARGPHGYDRVEEMALPESLGEGENVLAFEVAGYNVDSFYLLNEPAYLQAEVISAKGAVLAATSTSTAARILPERVRKVPRFSYQRPFCEVYRLSVSSNEWRTRQFDDMVRLAEVDGSRLLERITSPAPLKVSRAFHPLFGGSLEYRPETVWHKGRSTAGETKAQRGFTEAECEVQPSREIQRLNNNKTRIAIESSGQGVEFSGKTYALYDHGLCDTGFIGASIVCRRPGRLYFVFDEILLDEDVNPMRQKWECMSSVTIELAEPGEYRFEAFEPYAFRYLKILSDDFEGNVKDVYLREYKKGDATTVFRCSDEGLNRIFAAAKETFIQNAVDVFTDCPTRERAGWLCDSFFTGRAAAILTGKTDVERSFLQNYALCPVDLENGFLPMCYPADAGLLLNWNFFLVIELEEYLQRSGDRELVGQFKDKIERMIAALHRYRNSDGLLEKLPGWVFVEWSKANELVQDVNYPSNMTYAEVLDVAARLYGRADYAEEAEKVRETIRRQSWNGEWFCDNAVRQPDGTLKLSGECTETCQYYAFFFKTATKERYPVLWRRLVADFGPERKLHPETAKWPAIHPSNAFIGNYLRLECLSREGMSRQIINETKGYLQRMAEATGTLWENDDSHASLCHGFASYAAVLLFRHVLGVKEVDLRNKALILSEDAGTGIDWAQGAITIGTETLRVRIDKEHPKPAIIR